VRRLLLLLPPSCSTPRTNEPAEATTPALCTPALPDPRSSSHSRRRRRVACTGGNRQPMLQPSGCSAHGGACVRLLVLGLGTVSTHLARCLHGGAGAALPAEVTLVRFRIHWN